MWKNVPGFDGYRVSDAGEIFSEYSQKLLKCSISKFGYARVTLYGPNGPKSLAVHRIVADAFLDNPYHLPQVNHKNEIKTDNRVENLEWCSCSYNINYGNRNQIVSRKLTEHKNKTTARKVLQIEPKTGSIIRVWDSIRSIEYELGFAHSNIRNCCIGKRKSRGGYYWRYAA